MTGRLKRDSEQVWRWKHHRRGVNRWRRPRRQSESASTSRATLSIQDRPGARLSGRHPFSRLTRSAGAPRVVPLKPRATNLTIATVRVCCSVLEEVEQCLIELLGVGENEPVRGTLDDHEFAALDQVVRAL